MPARRAATRAAALAVTLLALAALAWPGPPRAAAGARSAAAFVRGSMTPAPPYRPKEFAFVFDQGVFHLFWMRHDKTAPNDSTEYDIGHAVSTDLVHWTQLDTVLHVQPGRWDSSHVWAPTIIKRDDTWYLFYAGVADVPYAWPWYQRIGVATSTDLLEWTRYDAPVYSGAMVPWAYADSSQVDGCQFRDPFVMEDPEHPGSWLMYYVTEPAATIGQLLVAVARSDGGLSPWQDVGPLWITDAHYYWGWCESPHLIDHDGRWYLFATTLSGHPIGFRVGPGPVADSSAWDQNRYRLWDFTGRSERNSDAWFASEVLRVGSHDYFAYVDSDSNSIGIEEIAWGTPPDFFSLVPPTLPVLGAPPPAPPPALALRLLGRARRGAGALLALAQPQAGAVRIGLYDLAGRRVRTLHDGPLPAGESLVRWDGRDDAGRAAPCAMYFARATAPQGACTRKLAVTE